MGTAEPDGRAEPDITTGRAEPVGTCMGCMGMDCMGMPPYDCMGMPPYCGMA